MQQEHIKPLTSMRFFAALWVILYTYWPHLNTTLNLGVVDKGYLGVDLFFILSGFIISFVYLEDFGKKKFVYSRFLTNRIARIYPLHIATLLATFGMVMIAQMKGLSLDPNIAAWSALPAQIFMGHAWGLAPVAGWNHPSWSISAEWFAYLCFPIFASFAWSLRSKPIVALFLSASFLAGLYAAFKYFTGNDLTHATVFWGALRIVPSFGLGCALFLAYRAGAVDRKFMAISCALASFVYVVICATIGMGDTYIVLGLGGLILSLAGFSKQKEGFFSSRLMVYLGEISFAMYMVYVPWKWVFFKVCDSYLGLEGSQLPLSWWSAGLLGVIPLAMLAHHIVELPMRRVVRALGEDIRHKISYSLVR